MSISYDYDREEWGADAPYFPNPKEAATMTRKHYGIEYAYGAHMINNGPGGRPDRVYWFPSDTARNAWVDNGPPSYTVPGARSTLSSRSPMLRRYEAESWAAAEENAR